MKNAIFDLDLTLVDTTVLETYRYMRDWQMAYANITKCRLYDGIQEVFDFIRANNVRTCIVSTSPSPYVERLVRHFHMPIDFIVGYHDAKPIKPSPAPMLKALQLLESTPGNAVSFGDRGIDILSSKGAGILSVACVWGTKEAELLRASRPDITIASPLDIIGLIR